MAFKNFPRDASMNCRFLEHKYKKTLFQILLINQGKTTQFSLKHPLPPSSFFAVLGYTPPPPLKMTSFMDEPFHSATNGFQ